MIIKVQNLKVNKVVSEFRTFLGKDRCTFVQRLCVSIVGHDSDGDAFVISAEDPTFLLPKEGDIWTLPYEAISGIDILQ